VLHCVAVCRSVLQSVVECCSVLQCVEKLYLQPDTKMPVHVIASVSTAIAKILKLRTYSIRSGTYVEVCFTLVPSKFMFESCFA